MAGDDHAVVVGITRYPDPILGDLGGPEHDAIAFRDWLLAPEGGHVPPANIRTVLTSSYAITQDPLDADPKNTDVNAAFERINRCENRATNNVGRRLYVYWAGHGFAPDADDSALLMANAGFERMGHHVNARGYLNWYLNTSLFREIVMFVDCCRDVDMDNVQPAGPPWKNRRSPDAGIKSFRGFAARYGRASREREVNGTVRGYFTRALLAGLWSGPIVGAELRNFVLNYMPTLVVPKEDYHEPWLPDAVDIAFSENATLRKAKVTFNAHAALKGVEVGLLNHDGVELARHTFDGTPWVYEVNIRRRYLLHLGSTGERMAFDVFGDRDVEI